MLVCSSFLIPRFTTFFYLALLQSLLWLPDHFLLEFFLKSLKKSPKETLTCFIVKIVGLQFVFFVTTFHFTVLLFTDHKLVRSILIFYKYFWRGRKTVFQMLDEKHSALDKEIMLKSSWRVCFCKICNSFVIPSYVWFLSKNTHLARHQPVIYLQKIAA